MAIISHILRVVPACQGKGGGGQKRAKFPTVVRASQWSLRKICKLIQLVIECFVLMDTPVDTAFLLEIQKRRYTHLSS